MFGPSPGARTSLQFRSPFEGLLRLKVIAQLVIDETQIQVGLRIVRVKPQRLFIRGDSCVPQTLPGQSDTLSEIFVTALRLLACKNHNQLFYPITGTVA